MEGPNMKALKQIHNDHLQWDGTFVGLVPKIKQERTAKWIEAAEDIDFSLVQLLRDKQRFAIAHVLLTFRSKAEYESDASQWNGLHVTLQASGVARYDERDMDTLYNKWRAAVK